MTERPKLFPSASEQPNGTESLRPQFELVGFRGLGVGGLGFRVWGFRVWAFSFGFGLAAFAYHLVLINLSGGV